VIACAGAMMEIARPRNWAVFNFHVELTSSPKGQKHSKNRCRGERDVAKSWPIDLSNRRSLTGPDFSWPQGKRLAFHVSLNFEHFAYGEGLGLSYSPGLAHPNTYNLAWREYGNRVGVWRLMDLFDRLNLPVSLLLNSEIYDHCPEVVAAFRQRGAEVVGHGRTNSEHQNDFDETGERKLISDVTEAVTKHEGKPPRGWLSPRGSIQVP
jgi:peptidoglycan/xylan/chitin deacetylase (PgdA/CDA1 family)